MRKMRKLSAVLIAVMILSVLLSACGNKQAATTSDSSSKEKFKVAFVYVGPVGDGGWTYTHDQGRKYLVEKMPDVEATYVESVPEGADAERVIADLAQKGNKVIFTTSYGYMDPTINVAKKYPDVVFMHCSGYKTAANVGTYFGRMEQPRYLTGLIAGKMTKSNIIGYVAAFPTPEVVRGINAFTIGVREVNPKAKVKVVWTNTWYNPTAEKDAAESLLDAGADVLAQHQDTPGPMQAAEERGAYAIGYNTDMSKYAPKANLTSPIWNWGPYYYSVVKAVRDGKWKSDQYYGGMADGIVGLAPISDAVPADVKKLVEEKKQAIIDGKFDEFTGPIKDQTGKVRVPAGQKMTDQEILNFNWFVEGVDGTLPK